jgi:hypothetical protein
MRVFAAFLVTRFFAARLFASAPATAAPLDKGHFHDVFTNFFDCDGTPVQEEAHRHRGPRLLR